MYLAATVALFAVSMFQVNTEAVASFNGTLKSVDKKGIVLAVENGETLKMFVTGRTKFVRNGENARASEFHSGDAVTVDAERDVRMNLLAVKVEFPARKAPPSSGPVAAAKSTGEQMTAEEIMRRVQENQDGARAAKTAYLYDENVFVRLKRGKDKVAREETRLYNVIPGKDGTERKLVTVQGNVFEGRKAIPYTEASFRHGHIDMDGDLIDSFAGREMSGKGDEMGYSDWFPLRSEKSKDYIFELKGEERYRDFDVYRLEYHSKPEADDDCWRGEALIEKTELQPILITTAFECKIPKAVTVMLGINVSQMGAKISYRRLEPGVWFPADSGGELKLRLFFLYSRTIAFKASNSDFRKADVTSEITFDRVPEQ